jgi:predicted MFS family arabinose efflux permease
MGNMQQGHKPLSTFQVLACGATIVTLSMGIRHGFGLWLQPITQAQDWTRETFAFAIAIQNLAWGISGIFAGMAADRFGAFKVIVVCSILYAVGLVGMAQTTTPLMFSLSTGVLIGMAQAGTTYAVIYGVIGRNVSADKRSWAMGVAAAAGSFGQFLMVPTGFLIARFGWQEALVILGAASLLMIPLSWGLREPGFSGGAAPRRDQSIAQALREAFKYPSFQLLMAGYFVCGFQVVFIGVHMPSYLRDKGLSPQVASYALALIGLFNVFGTYAAGVLGQKLPKKNILAFIYFARAVAISLFLLAPLHPPVSMCFPRLGVLGCPLCRRPMQQWHRYSVSRTFPCWAVCVFSHQVGSFMGVWLGGYL